MAGSVTAPVETARGAGALTATVDHRARSHDRTGPCKPLEWLGLALGAEEVQMVVDRRDEEDARRGGGLFGRLVSDLVGRPVAPASKVPAPSVLEAAESALDEAVEALRARVAHTESAPEPEAGEDATEEAARRSRLRRLERWRAERERARARLETEILELHEALGTGMDASRLARLRKMLDIHVPVPPAESKTIAERVEGCTLQRLYLEAGVLAWGRLEHLMREAGQEWPVPETLSEGRGEESLAPLLEQHHGELHDWFLRMPVRDATALILGDVPAWKMAYPDPERALWRETALRAVGSAIRAQVFVAALETWIWRPPELDQAIESLVEKRLGESRRLLDAGFPTLEAASQVMTAVERTCTEVVPERVWEFVEPRLSWSEAGGVGASIAVLAEGLAVTDPVCGMALSGGLDAQRLTWDGQTYFFCTRTCRDRFRVAPHRFATDEAGKPQTDP